MSELDPGAIVDGRYQVLSRLGAGGMADVFLVQDTQLSRKVALKLLHRRFSADPGFVERFRREAQAAASLQHPNVVGVYDRGAYDGTYYIAMEYLPGRSLKQLIREEAPLDPLRAIEIALQILKAARFAHRRGVIHRDLKPHNVIIDDADQAKVTDFGIARAGASDMTETGSIMGTAQYLSPEQAQGHAVSETSDLYSVGIVLYEMLTGRVPFDAESAVSIALKHVSEAPPSPREINPQVPELLEQVVLWSLNKNPSDRPADADQFITVLEQVRDAIVSGSPGEITASMSAVSAAAVTGYPSGGPGESPPTAMMPTAEALSRYEVAGLPETTANGRAVDRHDDDRPYGGGSNLVAWLLGLLILLLIGGGVTAFVLTRPKEASVPIVVKLRLSVAQAQVQNDGLNPALLYETSAYPSGVVIDQSPLGGVRLDTGSTVTLTVSSGPGSAPMVNVPTVTGLGRAAAIKQIEKAGLKVIDVLTQSSNAVPVGDATQTEPSVGTSVRQGSNVTLYLSSGQAPVAVAAVTGFTEAAAHSALTEQGFSVSTTNQPSSTQAPGTVLSQSPSGGVKQKAGSTVTLVIATAPTTASVPPVVGDTAPAARSTLKSVGFSVTTKMKKVTEQNEAGIVIAQSPSSGTAKKGSTVTIVVGTYEAPTTTATNTTTTTTPTTTNTTTTTTSTTP